MYNKTPCALAVVILSAATFISGCATAPPTEHCAPWMMAKSKPIPDVKSGDDIIEKYAELRSEAGKDKSKVRGLQACTRAMTRS